MPEVFSSGNDGDFRIKPRSGAPSGGTDGSSYTDGTGQPYWMVSGSWLEVAFIADLGSAAFEDTSAFAAATHAASHVNGTDDIQDATASQKGLATATQITKLDGIETGATADQTDAEIATAYGNEVPAASQAEMEAGTETSIRRMSPLRIKQAIDEHAAGGSAELPMHYIAGLIPSVTGTTSVVLGVSAGECRDAADDADIVLASAITKTVTSSWAVGDTNGSLDTGSIASDTLYAVWAIRRSDTGVVDILTSLSFTAPTMPTDYDQRRLIGAIYIDVINPGGGAQTRIRPFSWRGDWCYYDQEITDVQDSSITGDAFETGTMSAPPNSIAHVVYNVNAGSGSSNIIGYLRPKGSSWSSNFESAALGYFLGPHDGRHSADRVLIELDANSQLEYTASSSGRNVNVRTLGFWMLSRRHP